MKLTMNLKGSHIYRITNHLMPDPEGVEHYTMTFDNGAIIIIFPPFLISLFAKQLVKYFMAREYKRQCESEQ